MLAEKLETLIARGVANTRMRDFYDIYALETTQSQNIDPAVFRNAFVNTSRKRNSSSVVSGAALILDEIEASPEVARLTRSMPKKGCTGDNAACEGFFGRVKNEMFYGRKWTGVSVEQFIDQLDRYLHWYNESRIKMSLGARSPMEYRRRLGYA